MKKSIKKVLSVLEPIWAKISPPLEKFWEIDGEQRAAAFGYYAFFSLFPLVLLLVTLGSFFVDRNDASVAVLDHARHYIPLTPENQAAIIETIEGVIEARGRVGFLAFVFLLYGATRFFHVLVRGVNRAWEMEEYSWWRLPLKNLVMLGILVSALTFGVLAPVVLRLVQQWMPIRTVFSSLIFDMAVLLIPLVVLFYGFSMLYALAPRRPRKYSEVWRAALLVTALLWLVEHALVFYFKRFGDFNALYGAFGGIMALLLWIYISGFIIMLGACICASGARKPVSQAEPSKRKE
jgi:YihY family inner membrane protein